MHKFAILQVADQGPVESLAVMLRSVGYNCYLPSSALRDELRRAGADTVLSPEDLESGMGYDAISKDLIHSHRATPADLLYCDLYIDVKAHRNGPLLWKRWPHLEKKTLWYRINGGKPEHVIRNDGFDCGDEVNPPCPILTPNQWYRGTATEIAIDTGERKVVTPNWSYVCWPPYYRFNECIEHAEARESRYPWRSTSICLIHNINGWGYGALVNSVRELGVYCYGVDSPDGLIRHNGVLRLISGALAYVHLKSSDAPGYSLYEALACACPVVCTRRLIWRCKMQQLLIPGETCLVFDRETHEGLTTKDVEDCTNEVRGHLESLRDPIHNKQMGEAGREKLKQVMWSVDKKDDVESLRTFMNRWFGG